MKAVTLIAGILVASFVLAAGATGETAADRGDAGPNIVVTVAGTGMGTVMDAGAFPPISCPGNCSGSHPANTEATLTATEAPGTVFQGFTGVTCVGAANPCQFNVGSGVNQVVATFNESTPNDTDGDGVPDTSDGCLSLPGPAANGGCPDTGPAPVDKRCEKAKAKLKKAKAKLAGLKRDDATEKKVEAAERRVRKAAKAKRRACA